MPRAPKRKADGPITTGAMQGDKPIHRTVPATAANSPLSGVNSVFAVAHKPAAANAKPARGRGGSVPRLPPLDVKALQVRTDVQPRMHGGYGSKGRTRYDAVFDMLTAPGQCVPCPAAYKAALAKAAQAYLKARPQLADVRLRVLAIDADTCGVWREVRAAKP